MNVLIDFLSFKLFISPTLLIVMYYLGAVIVPILSWLLTQWLQHKVPLFLGAKEIGNQQFVKRVKTKYRLMLWSTALLIFVMLEIMWRMMFELFIAYFQIHAALTS